MRRTVKKTVMQEATECVCDMCGMIADNMYTCSGCGRDICRNCRKMVEYDIWTAYEYADYCDSLCSLCNDLLEEYGPIARALHNKCEMEIEAEQKKWKAACKETRT